jgi:two-component sensor histidine kinase
VPLVAAALDLAFGGPHDFLRRWLIAAVIGDTVCLFCFGGSLLVRELVLVISKRRRVASGATIALGPAFYFGLSALIMPCVLPIGLLVGARFAGLLGRTYHPDLGSYRVGLGFGAIMTALFFLHRARAEAREKVRDLENANLKAQLAVLTAEMNPHLLFNALNTIASLVHDDPDRAEETVLELAEVYRGALKATSGSTHPLAAELRLCEAYLRIEAARFGDRLRVSFHVDDGVDTKTLHVPMLLLQPLVENAVKHGIAPRASGGAVSVRVQRAERGVAVVVEDDGIGLGKSTKTGNGRALVNCKERLRLTYGDGASLDVAPGPEGGTRARLELPNTVLA